VEAAQRDGVVVVMYRRGTSSASGDAWLRVSKFRDRMRCAAPRLNQESFLEAALSRHHVFTYDAESFVLTNEY
jgi:precorrin-6x reductase